MNKQKKSKKIMGFDARSGFDIYNELSGNEAKKSKGR